MQTKQEDFLLITYLKFLKLNNSLKVYNKILREFIFNIISFSLLILIQQVVALPIISRFYDAEYFGQIILAFGISNIIASIFGFSIGNARLLDESPYNEIYIKLLKGSNVLVLVISFFIYNYIFRDNSYIEGLIYSVICLLGSIRFFFISEFRLRNSHRWIFNQNGLYFIGSIIGIGFFFYNENWLLLFLMSEILSVVITYIFYFYKNNIFNSFNDNSSFKLTNTVQLMINNGFSYSLSQYDRFVIYPLLGAINVSLYYSAAISSKIGGLVMNPLSNYILGKLSNKKEEDKNKIINLVLIGSLFFSIVYFILSIITTPLMVRILYPSFLNKIEHIIYPICLGASIMGGVNFVKPVIMKFKGVKFYNKVFLLYGVALITMSILLGINYSLLGIALANAVSSALLFLYLLMSLKRSTINKI
jgi:O-antigen/teichoic acid export membrane protein